MSEPEECILAISVSATNEEPITLSTLVSAYVLTACSVGTLVLTFDASVPSVDTETPESSTVEASTLVSA